MTTPQVLGERYEIGGVLGRGGMAEVHLGRDLRLGREVAVKVLRSDLARDPSFQVRFRREAQASASLNHPAIVAVYDTGEDRTALGATPYIVMEYVEGETLRDVLRREGHLSPERAMTLAADICGALDFSHRNGIVHRDVKPGNVMITPQGTVKVMDFGIARAVSDSAATMTSTAAVIGTAQYLSPEQARGESVDARSDVYSMGCLLYELATGAPPFTGDSPVSVAYQHVREDPRVPSSINPEVPADLDAILLKAMSKNPANRYQSAADMRNDLLRSLAGQRVEATPVMGDAEKTAIIGAAPVGYDDWEDEDEQARRRKRRIIIAVVSVLAVLLLGGAVIAALNMGGDDDPGQTVATEVQVPPLQNQPEAAAREAITAAGLEVGTVTTQVTTDSAQEGTVLDSTPASGAQVAEGTDGRPGRRRRARHRARPEHRRLRRGAGPGAAGAGRLRGHHLHRGRAVPRGGGHGRDRDARGGPVGRPGRHDHARHLHRLDRPARRDQPPRGRCPWRADRGRLPRRPDHHRAGRLGPAARHRRRHHPRRRSARLGRHPDRPAALRRAGRARDRRDPGRVR